jgi:hypothetical protein
MGVCGVGQNRSQWAFSDTDRIYNLPPPESRPKSKTSSPRWNKQPDSIYENENAQTQVADSDFGTSLPPAGGLHIA